MNDLTIRQQLPSSASREHSALATELAKMLGLVAPITMSADQQTLWLASAVEALGDAAAAEVAAVSVDVRCTVTRPSQIVPEVARLIGELRDREAERQSSEYRRNLPAGPPIHKHVMDRDRSQFTASDWQELNEHLERMGSAVRYRPDGSKCTANELQRNPDGKMRAAGEG